MKASLISLIALGVAAAIAGPVDCALADEPMVLTDAQLDRVTAGDHGNLNGYLNGNLSGRLKNNLNAVDVEANLNGILIGLSSLDGNRLDRNIVPGVHR